ncbi:glycine N-methyltransferase-like [Diadema antillarum]|uniref:glycine N-methyltransferase-like n=1 Tax=Diadema antillarum TaxID=105358 RepID=UPI003A88961E
MLMNYVQLRVVRIHDVVDPLMGSDDLSKRTSVQDKFQRSHDRALGYTGLYRERGRKGTIHFYNLRPSYEVRLQHLQGQLIDAVCPLKSLEGNLVIDRVERRRKILEYNDSFIPFVQGQEEVIKRTGNVFNNSDVVLKLGPVAKRSSEYEEWLLNQLNSRGCKKVLDVACGTGVDSIILLNHGMEVVSCDDAEEMLAHARKEHAHMKDDSRFGRWDIRRANWLTLQEDLPDYGNFDAVLCLGNSIFCQIDTMPEMPSYRQCVTNFKRMLKPGGLLLIDHRNMDSILDRGFAVNKNVYHKNDTVERLSTKILEKDGSPYIVEITFDMIVGAKDGATIGNGRNIEKVTVPLTPMTTRKFGDLLKEVFGRKCKYSLFGDLMPSKGDSEIAFFQHSIEKREN